MTRPNEQELKEFANAFQLSIKTKINDLKLNDDKVRIKFEHPMVDDVNLFNFLKLFNGDWNADRSEFIINKIDDLNWPKLTLFLLLTRMNKDNIIKLIELDSSVVEIADILGIEKTSRSVIDVVSVSKIIFNKIEAKNMTIRELAAGANLTQVTLGNFKAGKDIKLSNLLKIAKALGLRIVIK